MKTLRCLRALVLTALASTALTTPTTFAQGTAFTYNGKLSSGANPVTGIYDFRFALYDATNVSGNLIAGPVTISGVGVTNGLFTVWLDFGGGVFTGANRWLEVAAGLEGLTGTTFTTLAPRQPIAAAPYAITAGNLTGTLPAAQVTGAISAAQLPASVITNNATTVVLTGVFGGNGAALTNLSLLTLNLNGAFFWTTNQALLTAVLTGLPTNYPGAAADLNGDGKVDLLTADSLGGLMVLTNNGSGAFAVSALLNAGSSPNSVLLGDVNGDGKMDLIFPTTGATVTILTLTNNGAAGFVTNTTSTINLGTGNVGMGFAAADLNGDGKADLVVANANPGQCSLIVLTNNGAGIFASNTAVYAGFDSYPSTPRVADVNGDGKPDLITETSSPFGTMVFTNNGHGGFAASCTLSIGGGYTLADVNGDGRVELILVNFSNNALTVCTNNGSGGFGISTTNALPNYAGSAIVMADVNGDGKLDVIVGNENDTLTVLTNNGNGGFGFNATYAVGDWVSAIVAADINGDGKVDVISENNNSLTVLTNTGWYVSANFSASKLTSGTIPLAQLPACVITNYETNVTLSGVFNSTSDRAAKEEFAPINPRTVLAKVAALPISEWKYKAEAVGTAHLGPMAQDFHAAFGLNGADDKHISTVDESGVALAAIQGLNQKLEQQAKQKDAEIQQLKADIAELKAMVEKLGAK